MFAVKKKKAGAENTDMKNQDDVTDEMFASENELPAEKDNRVEVKIKNNTYKKEDEDIANEENLDNEKDPVSQLQEALAAAEKEKADINDRFLRAAADFDNYKKRLDRQWVDFKKYANESLAKELLTVVDNLERAIAASVDAAPDARCLVDGVKMTLDEILKILERFGVTPIKAAGAKFDPNYHQAVSTRKTDEVEENIVLEEYQKGYLIHDRLLRPAMVVVSACG